MERIIAITGVALNVTPNTLSNCFCYSISHVYQRVKGIASKIAKFHITSIRRGRCYAK